MVGHKWEEEPKTAEARRRLQSMYKLEDLTIFGDQGLKSRKKLDFTCSNGRTGGKKTGTHEGRKVAAQARSNGTG